MPSRDGSRPWGWVLQKQEMKQAADWRMVLENQDTKQERCQGTIMKDKEGVEVIEEKVKGEDEAKNTCFPLFSNHIVIQESVDQFDLERSFYPSLEAGLSSLQQWDPGGKSFFFLFFYSY